MEILYGCCHCGCGQKTSISKVDHKKYGWVKGKPKLYVHGHRSRLPRDYIAPTKSNHQNWKGGKTISTMGYVEIHAPNNNRRKGKYIFEHDLIAEIILGNPMPKKAVIHHVNEIKQDNRHCNLVICEGEGYHKLLHQRMKAFEISGNKNYRKCVFCKKYDNQNNLYVSKLIFHRKCHNEYEKQRRRVLTSRDGKNDRWSLIDALRKRTHSKEKLYL